MDVDATRLAVEGTVVAVAVAGCLAVVAAALTTVEAEDPASLRPLATRERLTLGTGSTRQSKGQTWTSSMV